MEIRFQPPVNGTDQNIWRMGQGRSSPKAGFVSTTDFSLHLSGKGLPTGEFIIVMRLFRDTKLVLYLRANEGKEEKKKILWRQGRVQLPPVGKLEQGGKLSIVVDVGSERERDREG